MGRADEVDSARADVDGDRSDDAISILVDRGGDVGCQAFLVVETSGGRASNTVWTQGSAAGLPQPRLHGFSPVNGVPGMEVLVDEAAGASTQFVGVFTLDEARLERVALERDTATDLWSGAADGLFPYGGSVGHVEAADCLAPGLIAVSIALPDANRYEVVRRILELEVDVMVLRETERDRVRAGAVRRFPEFNGSPFESC